LTSFSQVTLREGLPAEIRRVSMTVAVTPDE
jgi:hypothetical protein